MKHFQTLWKRFVAEQWKKERNLVQRIPRASVYINILSMLQCLGYSLERTLQRAKNTKWSSSNRESQLWHMHQKQELYFPWLLKITSENFFWDQPTNRLFTLTSLFVQAWPKEWNHNAWSVILSSCLGCTQRGLVSQCSPDTTLVGVSFLLPGNVCQWNLYILSRYRYIRVKL